jgi:Spy/CpxP family protein refolding chaperone
MMIRKMVGALVLAALVAVPVQARPGGCRKGPDGERPHRMWEKMDLSEEQKTQLKEMHGEMRGVRKEHWEEVNGIRDRMREELSKESPDRGELEGYSEKLGALHQRMTRQRIDHLLQLKTVLTAEQFEMLLDKEGRGCPMGKGGKCGRGGHKGRAGHGCKGAGSGPRVN